MTKSANMQKIILQYTSTFCICRAIANALMLNIIYKQRRALPMCLRSKKISPFINLSSPSFPPLQSPLAKC